MSFQETGGGGFALWSSTASGKLFPGTLEASHGSVGLPPQGGLPLGCCRPLAATCCVLPGEHPESLSTPASAELALSWVRGANATSKSMSRGSGVLHTNSPWYLKSEEHEQRGFRGSMLHWVCFSFPQLVLSSWISFCLFSFMTPCAFTAERLLGLATLKRLHKPQGVQMYLPQPLPTSQMEFTLRSLTGIQTN